MCLQKGNQVSDSVFPESGFPNNTLFFLQWTTPTSSPHLLINSIPAVQLKELANFGAAELHFARRPIPEHYAFCPVQDVTLLHASRVTEVAEKSLESIAGGPPVSLPMTRCMSNLTYAISEVFVACF